MRKIILSAGIILASLVANTVYAMPSVQSPRPAASYVEKVDYACGRGFHLSPRGYCRPNGPPLEYRRWDRRDRWEARREWRERRDWREHRAWHERRYYRSDRW
ncbi:GCG_CRPN prefix-to-repeats domain-containing protein [Rhizobium oryziradicis]|uniref:GCG_CRPN prefix-to-repeats domain-containing protein n=1 Tax=Rhizobium oryziradicis TaxID=1867956 RepID=UPI00094FD91A